ncbi:hypothetical protein JW890_01170 [candidate division WOR-3 bacterium]|nr:hypothetical protein [candidate division WOR-3 bacterium]
MIESIITLALTAAVFSFLWREGFLFRGAELLGASLTLSLVCFSVVRYFFLPQIKIASDFAPRYLWFVLGVFIVLGEIPKLKKASFIPMSILVGIGTALMLEGVVEGFFIPQITSILRFETGGAKMALSFASAFAALSVMLFFVIPQESENTAAVVSKTAGKVVLFLVMGVFLSALVFTAATYLSGRIGMILSMGRNYF